MLAILLAGITVLSLNAYAIMGGADFGGGVWDLFASGSRKREQRTLIADAIGPIWEANHVWLILVVVLLFTCFPPAFAELMTTLHIPLSVMLIGVVLRGSAFTFRSYDSQRDEVQRRWGRIFAVASLLTPWMLGVCLGAVASGDVGAVMDAPNAWAYDRFVGAWLSWFAMGVGLLALTLFAFLAAVYLTLEARDPELREDFRRRALIAAAAVFVAAFGVLGIAYVEAPRVHLGLTSSPWAIPLQIATGVAAVTTIWSLWTRRFVLARFAAAAQVSLIIWGWAAAQFPLLIPPNLTIADAASPDATLRLVLIGLVGGFAILIPSLIYLFRIFKGSNTSAVEH
jgi:cytochrome bd ubiquinol oxidase subunit II